MLSHFQFCQKKMFFTILVFSQFEFFTIWVLSKYEFCQKKMFFPILVFSQFEFFTIWVLSKYEFCHNKSLVTILDYSQLRYYHNFSFDTMSFCHNLCFVTISVLSHKSSVTIGVLSQFVCSQLVFCHSWCQRNLILIVIYVKIGAWIFSSSFHNLCL